MGLTAKPGIQRNASPNFSVQENEEKVKNTDNYAEILRGLNPTKA